MSPRNLPQGRQGPRKTILLVDDNALMRESIAEHLNRTADLAVLCSASSAREALQWLERGRPDLIITDLSMPGRNGFELVETVCGGTRPPPVLVLSMHGESFHAERALRAGAAGYVTKGDGSDPLLAAVRAVLAGRVHFGERIARRVRERIAGTYLSGSRPPVATLTDAEYVLLDSLGRSPDAFSALGWLARHPRTLAEPLAAIRTKLGLHNDTAVVHCAILAANAPVPA